VRSVGVVFFQDVVQPVLGIGDRVRQREADTAQSWSADRHEQRRDGFDAGGEIGKAGFDQVPSGERVQRHREIIGIVARSAWSHPLG
jgi:hypothetical protein